jgi:hypothetical protein
VTPLEICIVSLSDLANDPRVHRQIAHLSGRHRVTCVGLAPPGIEGVGFYEIPVANPLPVRAWNGLLLATRQYSLLSQSYPAIQRLRRELGRHRFDLVIANDTGALSFAFAIRGGAKVLFDAHEYAPREFEESLRWRLLGQGYQQHLCERYIRQCDAVTTVCEGIADEYCRVFGVRPEIITNATDYRELEPSPVDPEHIRLVHHGGAGRSRRIETMIEMMDFADRRFSLDLMLVTPPGGEAYAAELGEMARARANVLLRPPVPMPEIVPAIQPCDIGLYILAPENFNNLHALPNKVFEFVQARLALAVGPSPEMARLVSTYGLGIVAEDFSAQGMADRLNGLSAAEIRGFKQGSHAHARALSAERNLAALDGLIARMVTA